MFNLFHVALFKNFFYFSLCLSPCVCVSMGVPGFKTAADESLTCIPLSVPTFYVGCKLNLRLAGFATQCL